MGSQRATRQPKDCEVFIGYLSLVLSLVHNKGAQAWRTWTFVRRAGAQLESSSEIRALRFPEAGRLAVVEARTMGCWFLLAAIGAAYAQARPRVIFDLLLTNAAACTAVRPLRRSTNHGVPLHAGIGLVVSVFELWVGCCVML